MSSDKSATRSALKPVSDRLSFPIEEQSIEKYWDEIKAFETSVKQSEDEKRPIYTFYDGPPFATGLPHYGHILAGTIKDIVTRYAHQTGHHVTRRFGWDCHGLPVEYEIDQKLGIKTKEDVMKMGVAAYNTECRSIVQRYSSEWESRIKRMGRWIDFRNDYKTMDLPFMESVWWVFQELHKKGLVYRGFKVMPYSTACTTPLSNFEANLNYKEVADPAVVVSFPVRTQENTSFLAWTTTPWTLPSNMALCVHPEFDYVKVKDTASGHFYILAQSRLSELYPAKKGAAAAAATATATEEKGDGKTAPVPKAAGGKKDKKDKAPKPVIEDGAAPVATPLDTTAFTIVHTYKGKELEGLKYDPLFPYFAAEEAKVGAFRVITGDWVTADSGTGIVHCAPAFGEDDYTTCVKHGIVKLGSAIICPVDASGRFTEEVKDFSGRHVKEADGDIMRMLKKQNRVVKQSQLTHSYPFCWRSETPLIYKAVPSWFVSVETIKANLLANNDITYWVPAFVKEKRFYNWIKDARDWAISRNRYWGTPLPIWMSEDEKEIVIVGSVEELERLSGVKGITDLHKDKIDHITIPSKQGKGVLKRVEEVFDCWFESGSMPYAQQHYPFENKSIFENGFPADFIAEGLDQTRGWFYTLMVISTGLFNKPAFKNLIVNGLVLAADGKKMSKRLKNYPDPMEVVERHGADALRIYLINSPVVRAEPLRFKEDGVHEVVKKVFLPWFHAYRFWVENVHRYESITKTSFQIDSTQTTKLTNVMDRWIMASLTSLIEFVKVEMGAYRLYTVIPRLLTFIDEMTNWYVRMNRKRLKGSDGDADAKVALQTLFQVLYALTRLMAPFTPFLVESMYQNLKHVLPVAEQKDSVHYLSIPTADLSVKDESIERAVKRLQDIIELGRSARDNRKVTMKMPIKQVWIVHKDQTYLNDVKSLSTYLTAELNVRDIHFTNEVSKFVKLQSQPNNKAIGQRFKGEAKAITAAIAEASEEALQGLQNTGKMTIKGHELTTEEVEVVWSFQGDKSTLEDASNRDVLVIIDTTKDAELIGLYLSREIINRVQRLRKSIGLSPSEDVEIWYDIKESKDNASVKDAIQKQGKNITDTLGRPLSSVQLKPSHAVILGEETSDVDGHPFRVIITRSTFLFNHDALKKLAAEQKLDEQFLTTLQSYVASRDWATTRASVLTNGGKLQVSLDGHEITLVHGTHFYTTTADMQK